jgi:hypothetical protein
VPQHSTGQLPGDVTAGLLCLSVRLPACLVGQMMARQTLISSIPCSRRATRASLPQAPSILFGGLDRPVAVRLDGQVLSTWSSSPRSPSSWTS